MLEVVGTKNSKGARIQGRLVVNLGTIYEVYFAHTSFKLDF